MASCCIPGEPNVNVEKRDEIRGSAPVSSPTTTNQPVDFHKDNLVSVNKNHALALTSTDVLNERRCGSAGPNDNLLDSSDPTANKPWHGKVTGDETSMRRFGDMVLVLILFFVINLCQL